MSVLSKIFCLVKKKTALLTLAFSTLSLGGAYASEYLGGLVPCDLCWTQRYIHMIIFALSVLALIKSPAQIFAFYGVIISTISSAITAGYHSGIEYKWWQGMQACSSSDMSGLTIEEMMERINAAPLVRCDEVPWEIFNISMAGFNFLFSAAIALLFLYLRLRFKKT